MKILFATYAIGWALATLVILGAMLRGRKRKGPDVDAAPTWAIAIVSMIAAIVWPVFALVVVVKVFIPKRRAEFAPMGEAKRAEEMRRAIAQRAAERVRALHEEKKKR